MRDGQKPRAARVHLLDGTYELFRHHFGMPSRLDRSGHEVAATVGVCSSVLGMLESGVTHLGVATDHVIESFRNELWSGYKDGSGVAPELSGQFGLLEEALAVLGVVVWAMVEYEADDALATAASSLAADPAVGHVLICTPDKDLAQCVSDRVSQLDRRNGTVRDPAAVRERFGVDPPSIPDLLALVGDSADGFPGLPGWGKASAAAVLDRYRHLGDIPDDVSAWDPSVTRRVRNSGRLAATLTAERPLAELFLLLATLRTDTGIDVAAPALEWRGPGRELAALSDRLGVPALCERAERLAARLTARA